MLRSHTEKPYLAMASGIYNSQPIVDAADVPAASGSVAFQDGAFASHVGKGHRERMVTAGSVRVKPGRHLKQENSYPYLPDEDLVSTESVSAHSPYETVRSEGAHEKKLHKLHVNKLSRPGKPRKGHMADRVVSNQQMADMIESLVAADGAAWVRQANTSLTPAPRVNNPGLSYEDAPPLDSPPVANSPLQPDPHTQHSANQKALRTPIIATLGVALAAFILLQSY